MYYDELVDKKEYQLSYMKQGNRLYFNCAHALNTEDLAHLQEIEDYFYARDLAPAVYLDPETPSSMEAMLLKQGYEEVPDELEYWYDFDPGWPMPEIKPDNTVKIIFFEPQDNPPLLADFLKINGIANEIDDSMLAILKKNLLQPKKEDVKFICSLALKEGNPATAGLISRYGQNAYFSEGATLPAYRKMGLYSRLRKETMTWLIGQNCKKMISNCDRFAFSNDTYKKLGFRQFCHRRFFQKKV